MCRGTVSVGWDGRVYDCDFNQQLEMGLRYHMHLLSCSKMWEFPCQAQV